MKALVKLLVVICTVTLSTILNAQDIRSALVSYWPLDATDGLTTTDAGYGNNLTNFGTPTVVAAQFGNGYSFGVSSNYALIPHNPNSATNGLPIYAAGSYSVMFWIKAPASPPTDRYIFSMSSTNINNPIFAIKTRSNTQVVNTNKLSVLLRTDGGTPLLNSVHSSLAVFDDTWHHVAWVDDRGSVKLYVDGVQDPASFNYTPAGTFTFNVTTIGGLVRTNIAALPSNILNTGTLDELAIWQRALTQAEVNAVRTNGLASYFTTPTPFITVPLINTTNWIGDRFTFTNRAVGNPPFTYQWQKDGVDISGELGQILIVSNLTVGNSGTYSVTISNAYGQVTNSAVLTVVPDATPNIANGLVTYWPLDEVTNAVTPGLYSGNDFVLNAMDGSALVSGQFSNALSFDGVQQYGLRTNGFPIYSATNYTVAFWVKASATQSDAKVYAEGSSSTTTPMFSLGTDPNANFTNPAPSLSVYLRNDATPGGTPLNHRKSTKPVFDDSWHHVAWVDEKGAGKLYVDGVLDATDFNYTRSSVTLNQTAVGALVRTTVLNYFWGSVDNLAVWNRRLNLSEIQQVMNQGIPAPAAALPPSITQQPAGTNLYSRANWTFTTLATGTSPLSYQWFKDGSIIANATDTSLALTNLQVSDSGSYSVLVTNSAGSATSSDAVLTVTLRPAPPATFALDFDDRGNTNTHAGFESFMMNGAGLIGTPTMRSYGGVEVTVQGNSGVNLDDRLRTTPVNSGDFTEEDLLQDFIYANDSTGTRGIDVTVNYMEPNQLYTVTIWSFDSDNNGARVSDWSINGTLVKDNYTFDGAIEPTSNEQYRFSTNVMSDANGKFVISGRRDLTSNSLAVFLNALRISIPPVQVTGIGYSGGTVQMTFYNPNPATQMKIQTVADLNSTSWADVAGVTYTPIDANTTQATFSAAGATAFYRVTSTSP